MSHKEALVAALSEVRREHYGGVPLRYAVMDDPFGLHREVCRRVGPVDWDYLVHVALAL